MLKKLFATNRGSLIIDAACCIPIFLIAMGTVFMLIVQSGIEARAVRGLVKASAAVCESYAAEESASLGTAAFYTAYYGHYSGEDKKGQGGIPFVSFGGSETLSGGVSADNVVKVSVKYKTKIPLPKAFIKGIDSEKHLCFRPFAGESEGSAVYDEERVYIFPKSGKRYHSKNCRILKGGGVAEILTKKLRRRYRPCKLCKPQFLKDGAVVYLYNSSSGAYHRKECSVIEKKYICMPKSEVERRGYTPCAICGGGG